MQERRRSAGWWRPQFVFGALLVVAVLALHPAYYYLRFGVVTPLLLGGADLGGVNPRKAWSVLLDPDLGLFPNWPFGLALLAVPFAFPTARRGLLTPLFGIVASWYLATNLYAQAATTNVNSGATISITRYALWYPCLFFPLALILVRRLWLGLPSIPALGLLGLISVQLGANMAAYPPRIGQSYLTPTRLSRWLYARFPRLYDPDPEIFMERYANEGELIGYSRPTLVLGPECRKALLFTYPVGELHVAGRTFCGMSQAGMRELLAKRGGWHDPTSRRKVSARRAPTGGTTADRRSSGADGSGAAEVEATRRAARVAA